MSMFLLKTILAACDILTILVETQVVYWLVVLAAHSAFDLENLH